VGLLALLALAAQQATSDAYERATDFSSQQQQQQQIQSLPQGGPRDTAAGDRAHSRAGVSARSAASESESGGSCTFSLKADPAATDGSRRKI
jgi:hypothetical protein